MFNRKLKLKKKQTKRPPKHKKLQSVIQLNLRVTHLQVNVFRPETAN